MGWGKSGKGRAEQERRSGRNGKGNLVRTRRDPFKSQAGAYGEQREVEMEEMEMDHIEGRMMCFRAFIFKCVLYCGEGGIGGSGGTWWRVSLTGKIGKGEVD